MGKRGISPARTNSGAGLAASTLFHLLVFLALGLALRNTPLFPSTPTIEMRLVRLSATPTATPPPPAAPATPVSVAAPLVRHIAPPAPPPVAPAPIALPPAQPAQNADAFRGALRLTLGCAHPDAVKLTEAEREACRRMTAQTHAAAPQYAAEPTDPAKAERLRRGARQDEAWRDYRDDRSSDDYPGLRCAFGRDCEPLAPSPSQHPEGNDCPWAWCNMVGR